ncbi:MAG: C39 family peptidase [Firmicutes bacterium]|nr:C39 family peptidase [Bacillota bacterium]
MRKVITILLAFTLVFSLASCSATDGPGMVNSAVAGNLLKIEGKSGLLAGKLEGLEISEESGVASLVLKKGVDEGTFTSQEYSTEDFTHMVATWNASIYDGGSVEILARAKFGDKWTEWLTWGEFTPYARRGSIKDKKCDDAYVDVDTFILKNGQVGHHVQIMAVIRRDEDHPYADSPELRRICMTFAGGTMLASYEEEPVEDLPAKSICEAPGISQEIRYASIADSICSPTTMTVMLLSRIKDPSLRTYTVLLPEMYALMTEDNAEDMFGNWSFTCSGAGLYGYECYAQYAGRDILLQELAKGHTCGINVVYSDKKKGGQPYLEGVEGSTDGHLIAITGYEYEDGQIDDEHLYFYSSDSYTWGDEGAFRRYKWTELAQCWTKRVAYIIPSDEPEVTVAGGPMYWVNAMLEPLGNNEFEMTGGTRSDGVYVDFDTYEFERGDGLIAWCVDDPDVPYYANNKFNYTRVAAGGKIKLNVPETGFVSVYAISPWGYCWTAVILDGEPVTTFAVEGN